MLLDYKPYSKEVVTPEIAKMMIGEGLIMTHNILKVNDFLNKYMSKKWNVFIDENRGIIGFSPKTDDKNIDYLSTYMNNMGYFLSSFYIGNNPLGPNYKDKDWTSIKFEAKFDMERAVYGSYIYHVTGKKYLSKILKNGLIPKTKNKITGHPDRIYLTDKIESAKQIATIFKTGDFMAEPILLRISVWKLFIKYMTDQQFPDGFYTTQNIPPQNIEVLENI